MRAQDRKHHCCGDCRDPTAPGNGAPLEEYRGRVSVEFKPPDEEGKRLVDGPGPQPEPGRSKLRLERKLIGRPFGRCPHEGERDQANQDHLMPNDFRRRHGLRISTPSTCWPQSGAYVSRSRARPSEGIGGSDREAAFGPKKFARPSRTGFLGEPSKPASRDRRLDDDRINSHRAAARGEPSGLRSDAPGYRFLRRLARLFP